MLSRLRLISRRVLLVSFAVLAIGHTAMAQLPTGTILGVVKDSSGSVVAGASITARNVDTGQSRTAMSGPDGAYVIAALPVGPYELRAERTGFQTQVQTGLTLTVSQQAVMNFSLQVGSIEQTVAVTAEAPLVDVTSGTLGGLVNEEKVENLPLNGRNYMDLTLMQPGIVRNTQVSTGSGMIGTWFSSNGAPLRSNAFLLDGATTTNHFGTNSSLSGSTLGVEGIREYRVLTSSYSADYGVVMGSQTLLVSKSGTNTLHGSVFEYIRNSAISAANYFDTPASSGGRRLPQYQRNNFGGSLGGPIRKDKTFVFGDFEALRQITGATPNSTVLAAGCHGPQGALVWNGSTVLGPQPAGSTVCPQLGVAATTSTANGITTPAGAIPGTTTNTIAIGTNPNTGVVSPVGPLLALIPLPTPGLANPLGFSFQLSLPVNEYHGQVRVDHHFSVSDNFFVRYTVNDAKIKNPVPYPFVANPAESRGQYITLSEDHIFSPTLLNSFRLTYSRTKSYNYQTNDNIGSAYSFVPGYPMGGLSVSGITAIPGSNPNLIVQNFYGLGDDVFLTRGKHSMKLGLLVNYERLNIFLGNALWGAATFPSVAGFLAGSPSSINALTPGSIASRHWRLATIGMYIQDDVRVRSNLTLNVGLRYEFSTQVREVNGYSSALPDIARDTKVTVGIPYVNPSLKNFSPRFGFAWDIWGNGKTSLRGGAGLLYDLQTNLGNDYNSLATGTPPFSSQTNVATSVPFTGAFTLPFTLPANAGTTALRLINYNLQQPQLFTYSLTLERQLPFGLAATLSYTGSRGYNLMQNVEGNPTIPLGVPGAGGTCVAAPSGQAPNLTSEYDGTATACWLTGSLRRNTNFGPIQYFTSDGSSRYNSLQFGLNKRLSHGLQLQSAYTYSKLIDNRQGVSGADGSTNGGQGVNPLDKSLDYGPADFDQRHVYRFNALYNIPNLVSGGVAGKLLNGWWMSGILSIQSGLPFTVGLGSNRSRSLVGGGNGFDRPNLVSGRTNDNITSGVSTGCQGVTAGTPLGTIQRYYDPCAFTIPNAGFLGTEPRNYLRAPGLTNLDYSLVKDTAITETIKIQFRTEVFNILNHPNFSPPGTAVFAATASVESPLSTAGVIGSTVSSARQFQFALKVLF